MSTVACGSGAPSVSQNCWPTRWISLCLRQGRLSEPHALRTCAPDPPRGVEWVWCQKLRIPFWCTPDPPRGVRRVYGPEPLVLQNKTAPEPKKNILVILVYLCSRPAQGGGAGLLRYYLQNKTAPEPLVLLYYCCIVSNDIMFVLLPWQTRQSLSR